MLLSEAMKIENFEKFVANLCDKTKYFIHISNLKLVLNHRLVFKMRHRMIKFNQKTWMNTNLRKKTKIDFGLFQADEQFSFWKDYGKCSKAWKYK